MADVPAMVEIAPRIVVSLACTLALALATSALAAPVRLVDQAPVTIARSAPGVFLVDFGRVAFGNLRLSPPANAAFQVTVHFGEAFREGRVDRTPPGTVRYARASADVAGGQPLVVAPAADKRNTEHPSAVRTPPEWGVVLPFRWVEVEGWPGELRPEQVVRRAAFAESWDDDAAAFASADPVLDRIWDLCRWTIKATTFAGVYVDGDRERIAYEADAYLNQLSHYATSPDVQMARDTFDRLIALPTWPSEWAPHMVLIAHADWMQTGDRGWLASRYESLKTKLLSERARTDGLLVSTQAQVERGDIVDWPAGERDGFELRPVNTVVNAFHLRALGAMADLARALGRESEARAFEERRQATLQAFEGTLFDVSRGLYRDGEGSEHASLHANLFPLAFGLVPAERRPAIARWLAGRGMACSVYAAQYLLEALFENGEERRALELVTASGDRSWRHMLDSGTTITWEAWDAKYKPNQDWNHAWGAAPANLLPRYVLGVRPQGPGWSRALVEPHPAHLERASGKVPTPRGPIDVAWRSGRTFEMDLSLPQGVSARVRLPAAQGSRGVWLSGRPIVSTHDGSWWVLRDDVTGRARLEVR